VRESGLLFPSMRGTIRLMRQARELVAVMHERRGRVELWRAVWDAPRSHPQERRSPGEAGRFLVREKGFEYVDVNLGKSRRSALSQVGRNSV
jgi:hypothetical protein